MSRPEEKAPGDAGETSDATPPKRRRGRPPASPEARARTRRHLLDATRAVYERVGYHGLNVELIVTEAGVSRPTFYKHFDNVHEAIEVVIADVHDTLIRALVAALGGPEDQVAKVEAALIAWRDFLGSLGPMLPQIYEELHDSHSPASTYRAGTLLRIRDVMAAIIVGLGRPRPTLLSLDTMLNAVEYLGYRFHLETDADDAAWKQTRDTMLRLALALLGGPDEWANATELADTLDVELDPSRE